MSQTMQRWRWLGPIGLMMAVTIASGGVPATPPGPPIVNIDKVAHFLIFGLIATSILRALPTRMKSFHTMLLAFVVTSLFGITDELHQSTTPGRFLDIYDWIADTLGALVAVLVYQNWALYRKVLEKPVISNKKKPA